MDTEVTSPQKKNYNNATVFIINHLTLHRDIDLFEMYFAFISTKSWMINYMLLDYITIFVYDSMGLTFQNLHVRKSIEKLLNIICMW